jgi:RNA recognition motif-containing protein
LARMRKAGSAAAGHAEKPGGARKAALLKKGKIDHEMAVFVKNLPFDVDDTALYTLFSEHIGPVVQAKLIVRKETGKSRGFGYVEFASAEHVTTAIKRQEQDVAQEAETQGSVGSATASQGPLVIEGRKLSISRSNMSEAIVAEQKKKEEAAARKKAKGEFHLRCGFTVHAATVLVYPN